MLENKNILMKKQGKQTQQSTSNIEFDAIWKELIYFFFYDFMAFFLPKLHKDIDYSYPPEFLEQELQELIETIGFKKRIADKLVKVRLKSGITKWVFVHIEVQSYFERFFGKRMFEFFSWIFNKYGQSIVAIAIYTSKKTPLIFDHFEVKNYDTNLRYEFPAYKVMKQLEDDLIASDNIMALFVLANQYVNQIEVKSNKERKLELKKKIFELAIAKGIDLEKTWKFLIFVNHLMRLSDDMKKEFNEFLNSKLNQTMIKTKPFDFAEASEDISRLFFIKRYGEDMESFVKRYEDQRERDKEQLRIKAEQERIKAEQERIKAEQERMKYILKLYHIKYMTADQIAELLELDLQWVKKVISDDSAKEKKK